MLGQLHASFDVSHIEGYGLDSELEAGELARPSIRLIPCDSQAASSDFWNAYMYELYCVRGTGA